MGKIVREYEVKGNLKERQWGQGDVVNVWGWGKGSGEEESKMGDEAQGV